MKKFGYLNILLVILLFLSLAAISVFGTINRNFKTSDNAYAFFQESGAFNDLSSIVQLKIQDNYPPIVSGNIIFRGLANKLVNAVVTPDLVSKAAKPSIKLMYSLAQAPTSISNDKVVIDTSEYKQEINDFLIGTDLPRFVIVNAGLVVSSIPPQLTIVDLNKNPNNFLGIIIKARGLFQQNKTLLDISWMILILTLIVIIGNGIRHLKKMFEILLLGFGIAGTLIVGITLFIPWVISGSLENVQDPYTLLQQQLIGHIVDTLLSEVRNCGIWYVIFAVIFFIIWKFVRFEKLQIKVNRVLKKLHVPTVSVEIKS